MVVPALQPFMDRMAAVPEIKAVVDGSSAWGPMPLSVLNPNRFKIPST